MKIFGNKTHSLNEYLSQFPIADRKTETLVSSAFDFLKWLCEKHLEGWVLANISQIKVSSKQKLVFKQLELIRPKSNFNALKKAWNKPVLFSDVRQEEPILARIKAPFQNPSFVLRNNFQAPEDSIGHNDQRSDVFKIGLLFTRLFSDFNASDIEPFKALFEGGLVNSVWLHQELKSMAANCLHIKPNERTPLSVVMSSLESVAQHFSAKNIDKSAQNSYQQVLGSFKASLLDFSAKNQLFNFSHNAQYLVFKKPLNSLIKSEFCFQFEDGVKSEELKKLQIIRRNRNQAIREKGEDPLRLITHFLNWRLEGTEISTPLFWASVNLVYTKSFRVEYHIDLEEEILLVNEVLRIYFKEHYSFNLPEEVSFENVELFINELKLELEQKGAAFNSISEQLVLGNFNYQNLSIASDYEKLLAKEPNILNLNLLGFEKSELPISVQRPLHWDNHFVLPADPSQENALNKALGNSLVIEGPPGTGKSQTITNLIAQATEKGEKVLFVSEKRAALDVVYHKMQQVQLGFLSLIVHNTRKEKKEIIGSIKASLERLSQPLERDAKLGKKLASWQLEKTFLALDKYYQTVRSKQNGFSLNELFGEKEKAGFEYDESWTPDLEDLLRQEKELIAISQHLESNGQGKVWRNSIYSLLDERSFSIESNPSALLKDALIKAKKAITDLKPLQKKLGLELEIGDLLQVRSMAKSLKWLIERNLVELVLDKNTLKHGYEKLRDQYFSKKALLAKRKQKNSNYSFENLSLRELESALITCENEPESKELKDFASQFVDTERWFLDDLKSIIKNAIFEYKNEIGLTEIKAKFQGQFKSDNPDDFIEQVALFEDLAQRMQYHLGSFFELLKITRQPDALLALFLNKDEAFSTLESVGYLLNKNFRNQSIDGFLEHIQQLQKVKITPSVQSLLKGVNELKPNLKYCLINAEIAILELKHASIIRELNRAYLANPDLEKFTSNKLNRLLNELNSNYEEWLDWNADKLLDNYILEFQRLNTLISIPAAKLSDEEKQEKFRFKKGFRIIRNEIDKERSYKSLRELVHSDAKVVLDILKPVYLMSPVAVSEVFPCQKGMFDLVVFDEASQLRLEEVLPIVHRAKRVVVVGDSEQLPPTDFFRSNALKAQTVDNLQFASFLMAAKASFKSVQLHWHYRSQSPELIQFSNAAFYKNKLSVFPSFGAVKPTIKTVKVEGVYSNRANVIEAENVVSCLANNLINNPGATYAIIALSESQRQSIETVLERKRKNDSAFNILIEREETRFENNSFAGLLITNLENMQGEERDVVLISLGYGYDEAGKFRQNFGPIMRDGGDRRLNVLFSRAKSQMIVFHSFDEKALNNDQNVGLWTLKQFLAYAKAVENNDKSSQHRIIQLLRRDYKLNTKEKHIESEVVDVLKSELESDAELEPLFVANASEQVYYQKNENGDLNNNLLEIEGLSPNTWESFFISKQVLENRGFRVEKLSTQEVLKSKYKTAN